MNKLKLIFIFAYIFIFSTRILFRLYYYVLDILLFCILLSYVFIISHILCFYYKMRNIVQIKYPTYSLLESKLDSFTIIMFKFNLTKGILEFLGMLKNQNGRTQGNYTYLSSFLFFLKSILARIASIQKKKKRITLNLLS